LDSYLAHAAIHAFGRVFSPPSAYLREDVGNYALNRLIRLGAPILILWAIIPAIDEGSNDIFKLPELISWLLYDVPFTLRLDHLWFLYYLLIFYGVLLLLKRITPKALNLSQIMS
jgi:hypothetical protein